MDFLAPIAREASVTVPGWVGDLAMRIASERRERRKIALLHPRSVEVFALPDENDVTGELVLKVRGTSTVIRIVRKAKREQLLGLFAEDREENEEAVVVDLGEDFAYVWEHELPEDAVAAVLSRGRQEERDAA